MRNSPMTISEKDARALIENASPEVNRRFERMSADDWKKIQKRVLDACKRLPDYWEIANVTQDGVQCISERFGLIAILSGCKEDDDKLWLHLSLSTKRGIPNWEQMVKAKNIFLGEDALAVQVFPRKANYVNIHRFVLHLWECLDADPVPDFSSGTGTI